MSSIPDVSSWLLKLGAIPVDYILEAGDKKIVLPNQPSGVSIVGNHADETIYTFDTKKVIRHRGELRSGQITLTGVARLYNHLGLNKDGEPSFSSGEEHLRQFEQFLSEYSTRTEDELVFRALKENIHVKVTVASFSYNRSSGRSTLTYEWTLNLNVYQSVEIERYELPGISILNNITSSIEQIQGFAEAIKASAAGATNKYGSAVGDIFLAAANAVDGFLEVPSSVVGSIKSLAIQIRTSLEKLASAIPSQYGGTSSSQDTTGESVEAQGEILLQQSSQALLEGEAEARPFFLEYLQILDALYTLSKLQGFLAITLPPASVIEGFIKDDQSFRSLSGLINHELNIPTRNERSGVQYIPYTLRAGQSLLNVASLVYGSVDRWNELAEANDFRDAYTLADGSPVRPGQIILIPNDAADNSNIPLRVGVNQAESLNTDLLLTTSGDLLIATGGLSLVSGGKNIEQLISNIVRTTQQEITMFPDFGSVDVIGNSLATDKSSLYYATTLRENLLKDPRIIDVREIEIIPTDDVVDISLTVATKGLFETYEIVTRLQDAVYP